MKATTKIQNFKEVVEVSSSYWKTCRYCSALKITEDSIEAQINHYLGHGLKLLHIGTESSRSVDGGVWLSTVAVLGKDQ
jgi:hypothetical protein